MSSVNYRGFVWLDESVEHSADDEMRAKSLAQRWSVLHYEQEQETFRRQADIENGCYYPEPCNECKGCENGDECEVIRRGEKRIEERRRDREIEMGVIVEILRRIGARMMRSYEHWNEDEHLMAHLEGETSC